jgi:putative effector of murein hydrolase LrgA (UPF0299 family)
MSSTLGIGWFAILVIMLISLAVVASFAALIYVIVKRIQDKQAEDFEDRDN